MRFSVTTLAIETDDAIVVLTVSIGVAGRQLHETAWRPLLERADKALHVARRNGRNRVQVAPA